MVAAINFSVSSAVNRLPIPDTHCQRTLLLPSSSESIIPTRSSSVISSSV